jgi:hypothetical protein
MLGKIKYTRRAPDKDKGLDPGWLRIHRVAIAPHNVFLCEYTRVELTKEEEGKVYFRVMDGYIAVGQEAYLSKENAEKYLSDVGPQGAATVHVRYQGESSEHSAFKGAILQQWAELIVPGVVTAQVTLNSKNDFIPKKYTPIPSGRHNILTPDNSHKANGDTSGYARATPGMVGNDIWFPIGLNGSSVNSSRYIHVGHLSEGCVTTHALMKWTALYNYLISHRVPGSMGKLIGYLLVTK